MTKTRPRILLLSSEATVSANGLYFGAAGRAQAMGFDCIFRACETRPEYQSLILQFKPDFILNVEAGSIPASLEKIPTIRLGSTVDAVGELLIDEAAIGRTAAEHLLETGYRHLACLGFEGDPVSSARFEGFYEVARTVSGAKTYEHRVDYSPAPWLRTNPRPESGRRLREWLKGLPQPAGVFCLTSIQAAGVGMICAEIGLKIPDRIGLIGVGIETDQATTGLEATISKVCLPLNQIGADAMEMAIAWLKSKKFFQVKTFTPDKVMALDSTRIAYANDPMISESVHFIADCLDRTLRVDELARRAGISRSGFEQRFRAVTGRSPLEEIHRQRIERAKTLLSDTGLAIKEVADRCGIADPYQFSAFFRKQTGLSPRQFRAQIV